MTGKLTALQIAQGLTDMEDNTSSDEESIFLSGYIRREELEILISAVARADEAEGLLWDLRAWAADMGGFDARIWAETRAFLDPPPSIEDKRAALEVNGFTVGPRNPLLNSNHPGSFMVAEALDGWNGDPTKDGANGPWCIVGDDLDSLITEAYEVHNGFTFNTGEEV